MKFTPTRKTSALTAVGVLFAIALLFQNCSGVGFQGATVDQFSTKCTGADCPPPPEGDCSFNGNVIPNGESVVAFLLDTVPFGSTCTSESRTCHKGSLSGTYQFPTCQVGLPASCTFNGQTVAHGQSVIAYFNLNVPAGQSCSSETRTCNNGTLSGSARYASCSVGPASCSFNGQTIADGASITAFQTLSVPFGSTCSSESRKCSNGILSGSYTFNTCAPEGPKSCTFNGQTVAHGQSVTAYFRSTEPYGQTCSSETRTCNNGALSGSAPYASCTVGSPASCLFNGQTIADGASITAFQTLSVPFGSTCSSESRKCSNGTLSGSYTFNTCAPESPKPCTFNGQTIPHGGSVTAYQALTVPYGQTCSSENRLCTNGVLSGSFTYATCAPQSALTETFSGSTEKPASQVDILFVLDESISMDSIIDKIRSGFASITTSAYPADTLMGVTNTAPAYVTDTATNAFDVTRPFSTTIAGLSKQPGFKKLVNATSIQNYRTWYYNNNKNYPSKFSQPGCNEWFKPLDNNSNGVRCLTANTQVALESIGWEAGLVSLDQLVRQRASSSSRTFRTGSLVNVVFVSDTHDPGNTGYYGNAGAPAQMITYSQLRDSILLHNPGIVGLKFNGIVPLPLQGSSDSYRLEGMNVAGAIPTSKTSTEGDYNFAYLPFIKSSSGVVMNSENSDWTPAIQKMVSDMKVINNPVIKLSRPAQTILSVTVQGTVLNASEYTLSSDRMNLEITKRAGWAATVAIVVNYVPL